MTSTKTPPAKKWIVSFYQREWGAAVIKAATAAEARKIGEESLSGERSDVEWRVQDGEHEITDVVPRSPCSCTEGHCYCH